MEVPNNTVSTQYWGRDEGLEEVFWTKIKTVIVSERFVNLLEKWITGIHKSEYLISLHEVRNQ